MEAEAVTRKRFPPPRPGDRLSMLRRAAASSPTDPLLHEGDLVVEGERFWLEPHVEADPETAADGGA